MALPATRDVVRLVRQKGYHVVEVEQVRPNRWVLTLTHTDGVPIGLMVQARPIVGAADVHDLADLCGLRKWGSCMLLAYEGQFGQGAYQAHLERRTIPMVLCTSLPAPTNTDDPLRSSDPILQPSH